MFTGLKYPLAIQHVDRVGKRMTRVTECLACP